MKISMVLKFTQSSLPFKSLKVRSKQRQPKSQLKSFKRIPGSSGEFLFVSQSTPFVYKGDRFFRLSASGSTWEKQRASLQHRGCGSMSQQQSLHLPSDNLGSKRADSGVALCSAITAHKPTVPRTDLARVFFIFIYTHLGITLFRKCWRRCYHA